MNEDRELEEALEYFRLLGLPEEEFRKAIRSYFDNTGEMDAYIEGKHKGKHRA